VAVFVNFIIRVGGERIRGDGRKYSSITDWPLGNLRQPSRNSLFAPRTKVPLTQIKALCVTTDDHDFSHMGIDLGSLSLESKTPNYMLVLSACDRQKRRSVAQCTAPKKSGGLILGTLVAVTTVFRRHNRVDGYHTSLLSENGTLSFLIIASAPNVKLQKCGGNLTAGKSHAVGRGSGSSVLGP
jgi:hypothetical protein